MSLVNDMLRDLDRRKRLPVGARPDKQIEGESIERKRLVRRLFAPLVVVLVLGAVAGYYLITGGSGPQAPAGGETAAAGSRQAVVENPADMVPEDKQVETTGGESVQVNLARVRQIDVSETGFSLAFSATRPISYEVVSRNDYGIDLRLQGVEEIELQNGNIAGLSLIESAGGYDAVLELNRTADFNVVYREMQADDSRAVNDSTLTIETVYRDSPESAAKANDGRISAATGSAPTNVRKEENEPADAAGRVNSTREQATPAASAPATAQPETGEVTEKTAAEDPAADEAPAEPATRVRTPRELSFEEQDINNSREALQQVQRGQIMAAYDQLFKFIEDNPEAHQSRSTLATLLFAQQEYDQAGSIVDQGLAIAPNYAAYKKIKARLLMMKGRSSEAIQLLRNVPPRLENDPEYFELMASVYQQNGDYRSAIDTYQELIRNDRKQPRWWVGMGVAFEAMGDVKKAVTSYQAALQFEDLDPSLRQYSQKRVRSLSN